MFYITANQNPLVSTLTKSLLLIWALSSFVACQSNDSDKPSPEQSDESSAQRLDNDWESNQNNRRTERKDNRSQIVTLDTDLAAMTKKNFKSAGDLESYMAASSNEADRRSRVSHAASLAASEVKKYGDYSIFHWLAENSGEEIDVFTALRGFMPLAWSNQGLDYDLSEKLSIYEKAKDSLDPSAARSLMRSLLRSAGKRMVETESVGDLSYLSTDKLGEIWAAAALSDPRKAVEMTRQIRDTSSQEMMLEQSIKSYLDFNSHEASKFINNEKPSDERDLMISSMVVWLAEHNSLSSAKAWLDNINTPSIRKQAAEELSKY